MFKRFLKIILIAAVAFPLTVLANGSSSPKVNDKLKSCDKMANTSCGEDYHQYAPPYSCHSYKSGLYLGIQGSYVYTIDYAEFQGTNPSDPSYLPYKHTNHRESYGGGAYLGYGHIFDHGYLPYLGAELSFNLRTDYNDSNASFNDGDIYGKQINSRGGLSFDVIPGFFFDDTNTTLVYLRLGIEGDQFQITSDTNDVSSNHVYRPLLRAGAGVEHQIVNNFYIRGDYVFSVMLDHLNYHPYLPTYNDMYSSRAFLNTFSVGITYRF
jgi:opacity protein-like surface antigen